jgi:thioredoxin 1
MSDFTMEITDQNFDENVVKSDLPVVIDFWAPWCGPCKLLAPVMDQIAQDFEGKIKVGKMDIAQHQSKATELGIMSIPALLFYKDGQVVGSMIGNQPKDNIVDKINEILA